MDGAGSPQGRSVSPWIFAAVAAVVVLVGLGIGYVALGGDDADTDVVAVETTVTTQADTVETTTTSTSPAVVAIIDFDDAELAAEFGDAVYKIATSGCDAAGIGTGFAIDAHHIVTNRHVVDIDTTPMVYTRDGEQFPGRVIGWEEDPDIAVIEVDRQLPTVFEWVDTDTLAEGEKMVSLGYPLPDHDFSVTSGRIVSFVVEGAQRTGIRGDAALDRGNSGGPSLTSDGRVAGVVTYMDINPDGFQFVPIVISANEVSETVDWIIDHPSTPTVDCRSVSSTVVAAPSLPAVPSEPSYEYPGPSFYTVILASLQTANASYQDAINRANELAWDYDLDTAVLLSNDFSSMTPGYWVVYTGAWDERNGAIDAADYLRSWGIDAYAKQVTR